MRFSLRVHRSAWHWFVRAHKRERVKGQEKMGTKTLSA